MDNNNEFVTQDIILASVLKLKGFVLDKIVKMGNKGTFFFLNVDDQVINDYDLGKILCEPVAFNNQLKSLTTSCRRQ